MIKKGYGICHGISGNSYAFMQIYNITKNEKMRKYAY
jgi:lantibiotic modifying enzyme